MNTYGFLYRNTFNPLSPFDNLFDKDDDSGFNLQFKLDIRLSGEMTYVLVVTTNVFQDTGVFSIVALGTDKILLERLSK